MTFTPSMLPLFGLYFDIFWRAVECVLAGSISSFVFHRLRKAEQKLLEDRAVLERRIAALEERTASKK